MGTSIRKFRNVTCKRWTTFELPRESAARGRRKAAQADKGKGTVQTTKKRKDFSLITYKFHAMWDYVPSIREVATGDNWTTQTVRSMSIYDNNFANPFTSRESSSTDTARGFMLAQTRTTTRRRLRSMFVARLSCVPSLHALVKHSARHLPAPLPLRLHLVPLRIWTWLV